jgi:PhzF family phenazine biosynthesis protein
LGLRIYQVDAFTDRPFAGNPAAVCVLEEPRDVQWMQDVAREMNLSETAFLVPRDDGFDLRWFTPALEVDLCGHATLASAHILWATGRLDTDKPARFHTKSGVLTARRQGERIEVDLPASPPEPVSAPAGLEEALGAEAGHVAKTGADYLVELASEQEVRGLNPDFGALRRIPCQGFIATARGETSGYDCVSRYFAPAVGIDEDPVTGAAHCVLGPYWSGKLGKTELKAFQASARGGELRVHVDGDRVRLSGHAVTVLEADLLQG